MSFRSNALLMLLCGAQLVHAANPTPLADAAERGDKALVRTLIQQKANVNAAQGDGMTALHWAAMNDNAAIAQMLIDAKADLNPATRLGSYTPLHLAAKSGSGSVAGLLLQTGADVKRTSATGVTALMMAAASGSTRIVSALIEKGADVNAREASHSQTALMFAAASDRADVIRLLIKHGAKPELASKAADPGCGSIFAKSACGEEPDSKAQKDEKPGDAKLNELVEPVAAPAAKDEKAKEPAEPKEDEPAISPEEAAVKARLEELKKELSRLTTLVDDLYKKTSGRRRGATVVGGMTALLFAARDGYMDSARALVEEGADLNNSGEGEKLSPLVMAIVNGHFDLAKYLLENNADPNLANIEGLAPLYAVIDMQWAPYAWRPQPIASQDNTSHLELMKMLLEHGANPNARLSKRVWFRSLPSDNTWVDPAGATPFWRAAEAVDVEAMRLLVRAGADPKLPAFDGVTPLMVAAGLGWAPNFSRNAPDRMDAVKYCLELGLDVNAKSQKGYTALHGTAFLGNDDLIKFLVDHGADAKAVAKDKNTVADMANGPFAHAIVHPETIALLEKLGAKNSNKCRADTCLVAEKDKK
jgi:ankyrin repeat protein